MCDLNTLPLCSHRVGRKTHLEGGVQALWSLKWILLLSFPSQKTFPLTCHWWDPPLILGILSYWFTFGLSHVDGETHRLLLPKTAVLALLPSGPERRKEKEVERIRETKRMSEIEIWGKRQGNLLPIQFKYTKDQHQRHLLPSPAGSPRIEELLPALLPGLSSWDIYWMSTPCKALRWWLERDKTGT